jgi:hypothetical protein
VSVVLERPRVQRVAVVLSMALLVFTGLAGLYNGLDELHDARTPLQKTVTYGVLTYGVLGLLCAFGLAMHRRWTRSAVGAWSVVIVYVATMASIAYGGADASAAGALAGGMATALIAVGVWWTVRAATPR